MRVTRFSPAEFDAFKRDGYLFVPGLLDRDEASQLRAWTEELQGRPDAPGRYMKYFEDSLLVPGEKVLNRIENFCPYHEGFDGLVRGPDLVGLAGQLLGRKALLFKEKINFKMPGGSGFTPHQDAQAGWNTYAKYYITAMISIDACTMENGCLEMVAGAHDRGLLGELWKPLTEQDMRGLTFKPYPAAPGDAMFFDSYAPHRSAPNLTNGARRVLYLTYNPADEGDHRDQYYVDKRKSYPPDCEREAGKAYAFKV